MLACLLAGLFVCLLAMCSSTVPLSSATAAAVVCSSSPTTATTSLRKEEIFGRRDCSFFPAVVVVRPKVYITSLSIVGARRNFSLLHSLHLDSLFVLNCILRLYNE